MSTPDIKSFEDFWPYYVRAHRKPETRTIHSIGTSVGAAVGIVGLLTGNKKLLPVGAVIGYACAWYSHFLVEGNKPATFGHPLYSFAADWVMISKMVRGTMDAEVERYANQSVEVSAAEPASTTGDGVLH
ncbi:MAG: hypothetical protein JWM10_2182 [Myxococcaceae bacterium]|nr:hypothetical protein [Myxococcaceae bacterium]